MGKDLPIATGFGGLDSRNFALPATNPPNPPKLPIPSPVGFGFVACRGGEGPFSGGGGDLVRPAFSSAACSSALVGSLIGVFTGVGDAEGDCLLHREVALFTEKPSFDGEGSSWAFDVSVLDVDISFDTGGGVS